MCLLGERNAYLSPSFRSIVNFTAVDAIMTELKKKIFKIWLRPVNPYIYIYKLCLEFGLLGNFHKRFGVPQKFVPTVSRHPILFKFLITKYVK